MHLWTFFNYTWKIEDSKNTKFLHTVLLHASLSGRYKSIYFASWLVKHGPTKIFTYPGDLIERRKDTHSVNTRNREKLSVPIHKTEKYNACFRYMASLIKNTLSDSFRQDRYNKKATKQLILRNVLE